MATNGDSSKDIWLQMGSHIFCSLETYFSSEITACVLSKNPALPSAALNQAITLGLGFLMYSDSEKDNNIGPHFPGKSQPCFPACLATEEAAQQRCFV